MEQPSQPRLYHELADLWPLVSPREEYAEEAATLRTLFQEKLGLGRHLFLDLGVGGGHHLSHLTDDFDATAVDLSPKMLAHSRRLNPIVEHYVGDMRSVRLDRKFDAVLIHDAVSYLLSEDDICATLTTASAHLRPRGVLIMCPDWYRETFRDHSVTHSVHRDGDRVLTYIDYLHDPDPKDTTVETVMFFLLREGGQLVIEQDCHTQGLFSKRSWLSLMEDAGFDAEAPAGRAAVGMGRSAPAFVDWTRPRDAAGPRRIPIGPRGLARRLRDGELAIDPGRPAGCGRSESRGLDLVRPRRAAVRRRPPAMAGDL